MQLVERHIIKGSKSLEEVCTLSKNLYNQSLYYLRQSLFGNIQRFTENELVGLLAQYNDADYRALPAQTSQQIVKVLFKNWKSYWFSIRKWKEDKTYFNGKPKIPNYKKKQFPVYFTKQQLRVKDGYIFFEKKCISPVKTKASNIYQVRVIPQPSCHIIEIIYEKETTDLNLDKDNILSLDLGLSNLATSINNVGLKPFIINGNPIKAFNQWYNKNRGSLQSNMKIGKHYSKGLVNLIGYRNRWIEDKLHKISRFIVNYAIENNIGTIIIGKNSGWKNNINIGKKNNQAFCIMPISKLITQIEYKAKMVGINVICNEESYTSKCDSIALEPIHKHEAYLGKRVRRGLFQSSTGKLINADGNGACNIARKVIGDSFMKKIFDSRQAFCHYKVNIL
jgi:putative transposase